MSDKRQQSPREKKPGRPRTKEARTAAALALATGTTIRSAAESTGMSERQLREWRKDPDFMAQVDGFLREITDQTIGLQARLRAAALVRVGQALPNPDDRIGVRAADVLLRNTNTPISATTTDDSDGLLMAYLTALGPDA